MDIFLQSVFVFSGKAQKTQETYQYWVLRLCRWCFVQHPLDVRPEEIKDFYLTLHRRGFSLASLEIVRAALLYFYTVLCHEEAPDLYHYEHADTVKKLFSGNRRHAYTLPETATQAQMSAFLDALPHTNAGTVLRRLYATGSPIQKILKEMHPLKVSRQYLQKVCAKVARQVGIAHGFGLRGIRASGIVHRIQNRKNDVELVEIFEDAGVSSQQFRLYKKAAGQ